MSDSIARKTSAIAQDPGHMPSGRVRAKWDVAGLIIVVAFCTPVLLPGAPMPQEHFEIIPVDVSDCLDRHAVHSNLSFSPDGLKIAYAINRCVSVLDTGAGKTLYTLKCNSPVRRIQFSPDGKCLAVLELLRAVIYDAANGTAIGEFSLTGGGYCPHGFAAEITWTPDGQCLAACTGGGKIDVWDLRRSSIISSFQTHDLASEWSYGRNAAIFVSAERILTAGIDGKIRLWNIRSGHQVRSYSFQYLAREMEVCCKGTRVAVVAFQRAYIPPTAGSRVTLLDLATGKKRRLSPKAFELSPMAYSPDGTKLALTVGRSVKVYSVDQGRYIGTLQVEGRVADLVFSPDGRFLAALGDKLRIWRCPE